MKKKSVAVVIISNGPGELTTWVKPVINNFKKEILTLKSKKHIDFHLRLILVPCPNANGNEYEIAKKWPNLDFCLTRQSKTGFTQVANSPGPLETITTAADSFEIAVNIIN